MRKSWQDLRTLKESFVKFWHYQLINNLKNSKNGEGKLM